MNTEIKANNPFLRTLSLMLFSFQWFKTYQHGCSIFVSHVFDTTCQEKCCAWGKRSVLRVGFLNSNNEWTFYGPQGKVMFSEVSVILSTGVCVWCHFLSGFLVPCSFQGVMMSLSDWLPGPMFLPGGVSVQGGDPPGTDIYLVVTAAVLGTHLAGMHSYWICD